MIPSSIGAVAAFLLLVTPGILFNRLQDRMQPTHKVTTFVETTRVVMISTLATTLSGLVLSYWWIPIFTAMDAGTTLPTKHLLVMSALTTLLACLIVFVVHWITWGKAVFKRRIKDGTIAFRTLVGDRPGGSTSRRPTLIVELSDGTVWRGDYHGHDVGPDDADPQLVLAPQLTQPLERKRPNDTAYKKLDKPSLTLLPMRQIRSTQVIYYEPESQSRPSGRVEPKAGESDVSAAT